MNWHELSNSSLEEILTWAENQSWCEAMAACRQDAGWHAEGDVWTHTKMVCAELARLEEWPELSAHDKTVLIFTALFHDAAKPLTTEVDPETGRTRSPKHAVKGEHLARGVLRELGCELEVREEIARMVRFHGRSAFLLERADPAVEVVSLSWLVNNRLLYLFAMADTRGRKTAETSRPEENLQLWKLVAEEQACFETRYAFGNDQARFLFFRQETPQLHYVPHEEYRCRVTMLSGFPGSGKDSWIGLERREEPMVSLDEVRQEMDVDATENQGEVIQEAREKCREFLRARVSFVFNATNLLRQTRRKWIDLFADYGARIEIVYLEPEWDVLLEQNKHRERAVPESVIRELARKCEPPTWTEAHEVMLRNE